MDKPTPAIPLQNAAVMRMLAADMQRVRDELIRDGGPPGIEKRIQEWETTAHKMANLWEMEHRLRSDGVEPSAPNTTFKIPSLGAFLWKHNDPVPFAGTKNHGGFLPARYLVMHYTASGSLEGTVDRLQKNESLASAHIVIGRDGEVVQMVPFNEVAWHAGRSSWKGVVGLNDHSIGIELVNWGHAVAEDDEDVVKAAHRNGGPVRLWQTYPAVQMDAAVEVARAICQRYEVEEILGHDDISPGRKTDPGPAFDMGAFRARVMGS